MVMVMWCNDQYLLLFVLFSLIDLVWIFFAQKSCSNFFYLEKRVRDFFMGFRDYEHEGVAYAF